MENFKVKQLKVLRPMKLYQTEKAKKTIIKLPNSFQTINIREDEFYCLKKDLTLALDKKDAESYQDIFTGQNYPIYYPHGTPSYTQIQDEYAKENPVIAQDKVFSLYNLLATNFQYNLGENYDEIRQKIYEESFTLEELEIIKNNLSQDESNTKITYTHRYTDLYPTVLDETKKEHILPQINENSVKEKKTNYNTKISEKEVTK